MAVSLLLGDCIEKMKSLPAKSVDCFVCDLPYGQLTAGGIQTKSELRKKYKRSETDVIGGCPWDVKIDLSEFWKQVKRLCKDDHTPVIMFCNTKFGFELYNSNPDWFRYDLVWNKQRGVSFLLANKMPMKSHEMIYVFCKKGAFYNRVDNVGANDGTTRCALSVIDMPKPNTLGHPTEKPIDLYKWILERYCPKGGLMLDPTAGSFNSILAAKQLELRSIGIEKDNTFFCRGIQKVYNAK